MMSGFDDKDEINQEMREKAHQEKPILINRISLESPVMELHH